MGYWSHRFTPLPTEYRIYGFPCNGALPLALTIATMPARTASGNLDQRSTTTAKSGSSDAAHWPFNAKAGQGLPKSLWFNSFASFCFRFAKPQYLNSRLRPLM